MTEKPEILFARLDVKEIMEKVDVIQQAQKAEFEAAQRALGEEPEADSSEESAIDLLPKRKSPMMIL